MTRIRPSVCGFIAEQALDGLLLLVTYLAFMALLSDVEVATILVTWAVIVTVGTGLLAVPLIRRRTVVLSSAGIKIQGPKQHQATPWSSVVGVDLAGRYPRRIVLRLQDSWDAVPSSQQWTESLELVTSWWGHGAARQERVRAEIERWWLEHRGDLEPAEPPDMDPRQPAASV